MLGQELGAGATITRKRPSGLRAGTTERRERGDVETVGVLFPIIHFGCDKRATSREGVR